MKFPTTHTANFFSNELKKHIADEILGPEFGVIDRINNYYIKSILIKSKKGSSTKLKERISRISQSMKNDKKYRNTKIVIDVDPC